MMINNDPKPAVFSNRPANKSLRLILLALLGAGLLAGCAQIRKATYPSDFVYLEQKQITTEMASLSLYMRQLDRILLDDSTISSEQQRRILAILSKIETSASKLGAGSVRTNHLLIDSRIDQFTNDAYVAIHNASANPPNYFALGRLSGSCVGCHKFRKN